jgi:hypothetical protein
MERKTYSIHQSPETVYKIIQKYFSINFGIGGLNASIIFYSTFVFSLLFAFSHVEQKKPKSLTLQIDL